jgi:hypothetical protein
VFIIRALSLLAEWIAIFGHIDMPPGKGNALEILTSVIQLYRNVLFKKLLAGQ